MVVVDVPMLATMAVMVFALLALGLPLWLIFFVTSATVIYLFMSTPMSIVGSAMFGSLDNFVLLAVPAFIFVGEILTQGEMGDRLINWLRSLVGPIPGGVPITTVASGEMFGAISGSSAAAVAAIGKIMYPAIRHEGYSERFGLGLVCSSGAIAIVIPPSISMILFAAVADVSLGRLFIAGIIPGIILGGGVAIYSILISYRHDITRGKQWELDEIQGNTKAVLWTLGLPVIIFGGIYGGFATATEIAVVAAAYAVFVSLGVYRKMDLRGVWTVAFDSATLTAKIFLITASAGLFSWVLTVARLPQALADTVSAMDVSIWTIFLMVNIVLILAGMFIDPVSNVLVLTPIFLPVVEAAGMDPLHFGVVMVVNMAIGMFTPPFGLNIFVVSSIFDISTTRITRGVVPFFFIYLVGLMLITYIPELSLWLPSTM